VGRVRGWVASVERRKEKARERYGTGHFVGAYRGVGGVIPGPTLDQEVGEVHGMAHDRTMRRLCDLLGGQGVGLLGVPDSLRKRSREGGVHVHHNGAQGGNNLSSYAQHMGLHLLPDREASHGRCAGLLHGSRDGAQRQCQLSVAVSIPGMAKGVMVVARGHVPLAQAVLRKLALLT
jgi:hypothetical protein